MTREQCTGCEYLGDTFPNDAVGITVKGCKHPQIIGGLGLWIDRVKECPKENEDPAVNSSLENWTAGEEGRFD